MRRFAAFVLGAIALGVTFDAFADRNKSYPWDDAYDRSWGTEEGEDGSHLLCSGDWSLKYTMSEQAGVTNIAVKSVVAAGTDNVLNFDTVADDTGMRIVEIGGFSGQSGLKSVIFPSSLTNVVKDAFKQCPDLECDLVFPSPDPVRIGGSAFYGCPKVKSVTITGFGSYIDADAFSNIKGWAGKLDISGVTYIGDRAFSGDGSTFRSFSVVFCPALAYIGRNAFYKQRGASYEVSRSPRMLAAATDVTGSIGSQAFYDNCVNYSGTTLVIPFKGPCTIGDKAFNWMTTCTNFVFWGGVPTLEGSPFYSIGNDYSYAKVITCCVAMDSRWKDFATPCTPAESNMTAVANGTPSKAKLGYPGPSCLGTYTSAGGCVFWVVDSDSPYAADDSAPMLDTESISVRPVAGGYRIAGTLFQGRGVIKAEFGDVEYQLTAGEISGGGTFDKVLTIGGAADQLTTNRCGRITVTAVNDRTQMSTWTSDEAIYTGEVAIERLSDAKEALCVPGTFRISRSAAVGAEALKVFFTKSGSAVAGQNYKAFDGFATIPAGEDHVDVVVTPFFDETVTEDTDITLTLTNEQGFYFISGEAGSAEMKIINSNAAATEVYVDSAAEPDGDGTESMPFRTIREGVLSVVKNGVVYVKGGEGRSYPLASDADQILIPPEKTGLTIAKWGDEKPTIEMVEKFDKTRSSGTYFVVQAGGVTLSGLRFVYSYNCLSELSYAGDKYPILKFAASATGARMLDCVVERGPWSDDANDNRYGTGQGGLIHTLIPLEVTGCSFISTRSDNGSYQFPVFMVPKETDSMISGDIVAFSDCYFTNCTQIAVAQSGLRDFSAVSCLFVNCAAAVESCSMSGNPSDGLFRGAANGVSKLTLAYNVFYNDASMAGRSKTLLQSCRETFQGGLVFHHNTVIGWDNVLSRSNIWKDNLTQLSMFDNILMLTGNGFVVNEGWWYLQNSQYVYSDTPSSLKAGSFIRNNYINCNINGGTLTDYEDYDFASSTAVSDTIAGPAPVFASYDITSPKFLRMKRSENPELTAKGVAWLGEDGEYPDFIGAFPAYDNLGFGIHLR